MLCTAHGLGKVSTARRQLLGVIAHRLVNGADFVSRRQKTTVLAHQAQYARLTGETTDAARAVVALDRVGLAAVAEFFFATITVVLDHRGSVRTNVRGRAGHFAASQGVIFQSAIALTETHHQVAETIRRDLFVRQDLLVGSVEGKNILSHFRVGRGVESTVSATGVQFFRCPPKLGLVGNQFGKVGNHDSLVFGQRKADARSITPRLEQHGINGLVQRLVRGTTLQLARPREQSKGRLAKFRHLVTLEATAATNAGPRAGHHPTRYQHGISTNRTFSNDALWGRC
jgi:hypothetical protein